MMGLELGRREGKRWLGGFVKKKKMVCVIKGIFF
jgi:hypothetical protein